MEKKENLDKWVEVEGINDIWKPVNFGDCIQGVIVELKTDKDQGLYATILQKDNTEIKTPTHKVLQSRLANCKAGEYIKISYEKEELPKIKGRNATKIYKVLRLIKD